ncbi:hypothetical protein ACFWOJ_39405 [Streptomyces sp. NPDC058439]|uniref:hypothetical protein n=1 Tax=Streptomyces sp. NPDC058439 TaxID=3346500 RepID=UPI003663A489
MNGSSPRHAGSEATRLLCAGSYLSPVFRRQVVDELVSHEERTVAPSLGVDVLSVLAHALRARRQEVMAAVALLVVWIGFFATGSKMLDWVELPVPGFALEHLWAPWYALVCLGMLLARYVCGLPVDRYVGAPLLDGFRKLRFIRKVCAVVLTLVFWALNAGYWIAALFAWRSTPAVVLFPLLIAFVVWVHRARVTLALRNALAAETFRLRQAGGRGIQLPDSERYFRLQRLIANEQHASGAVYNPQLPFVGAGAPHQPWSLALELQRKRDEGTDEATIPVQGAAGDTVLTPRNIIDLITPRLESLRESASRTGRDRLKDLEIEEFVYLPPGAARGDEAIFGREQIRQHIDASVDEGAEGRRHFLRVRIGAWDEQVVVTIFVRVHTQGRMLVLEVAPHVLGPIKDEFMEVDAVAARSGRMQDLPRTVLRALFLGPSTSVAARDWPSDVVRAFFSAPSVSAATGISALRTGLMVFRTWLSEPESAMPGAPVKSVREMGSAPMSSLFQEMDVSRYVKTVQDRIASGVRDALEQSGYQTDRFEQQIINVGDGGLFIRHMAGGTALGQVTGGAVATGERGRADNTSNRAGMR